MAAQVSVTLGGKEFICSPLSLKDLKLLDTVLTNRKAGTQGQFDSMRDMAGIVLASLKKGAPDITLDYIEDNVNLVNYYDVVNAVMTASGLKSAPNPTEGEVKTVGEEKRPTVSA